MFGSLAATWRLTVSPSALVWVPGLVRVSDGVVFMAQVNEGEPPCQLSAASLTVTLLLTV